MDMEVILKGKIIAKKVVPSIDDQKLFIRRELPKRNTCLKVDNKVDAEQMYRLYRV
ncbi:hypothetical protein DPMN_053724 [Dreissena polymorpha]|uniref:Uncharacterized protein n=1 Tax=Dreissena polymorpha TaxID=45954 RepID=A0A9D4HQJ2_DREPO|nr:hypothetical protein DPMN_053724 [Dreissena polymorpha]